MKTNGNDREAFAAFLLRMRARGIAGKELIAAIEATPRRGCSYPPASGRMPGRPDAADRVWRGDRRRRHAGRSSRRWNSTRSHRVLEIGTGTGFTAAVMAAQCRARSDA
jgi:protein-L-isoaspartate(D-aspartate) O-methyltransferase